MPKSTGPVDPNTEIKRARSGFEMTRPQDVIDRTDLSTSEKIAMLEQWEQDLREQMVAEEEAMSGGDRALADTLTDVLRSMERLGSAHRPPPVPSKHG
jgi:hypothetical protein